MNKEVSTRSVQQKRLLWGGASCPALVEIGKSSQIRVTTEWLRSILPKIARTDGQQCRPHDPSTQKSGLPITHTALNSRKSRPLCTVPIEQPAVFWRRLWKPFLPCSSVPCCAGYRSSVTVLKKDIQ
jgi:hypothetical protein